jgi:hypothetical protein
VYSYCTRTVLILYSYCTRTVLTLYSHCTHTLHSYTVLIHCTHTLHSYTVLIHCTHTLHSHTTLTHCTHTLHPGRLSSNSPNKLLRIETINAAQKMVDSAVSPRPGVLSVMRLIPAVEARWVNGSKCRQCRQCRQCVLLLWWVGSKCSQCRQFYTGLSLSRSPSRSLSLSLTLTLSPSHPHTRLTPFTFCTWIPSTIIHPLDPIHHHISVGSHPPPYIRWIPSARRLAEILGRRPECGYSTTSSVGGAAAESGEEIALLHYCTFHAS